VSNKTRDQQDMMRLLVNVHKVQSGAQTPSSRVNSTFDLLHSEPITDQDA